MSSNWGNVTAGLADNTAARSLIQMLPITIEGAVAFFSASCAACTSAKPPAAALMANAVSAEGGSAANPETAAKVSVHAKMTAYRSERIGISIIV